MSFAWEEIAVHFEVAFGYTAQDAAPVWMDISEFVEEFDTNRGRNTLLGRWEPGQATWWVDNSSGRFDPNNTEDGPNQIRNPGFEDGILSPHVVWDSAGGSADWAVIEDAGLARTGTWVLRHDASSLTGNTRLQLNGTELEGPGPHIPIAAGRTVRGRFYARSGSTADANRVRMRAEFFDAAAAHVGGTGGSWLTPTTGDWETEIVEATAPAGAVYVVFDLEIENTGNPEDIIYFEDSEGIELYPEVRIGAPARIRVVHDSIEYVIFRGTVTEWPLQYETASEYAYVQVPIVENRALSLGSNISGSFPVQRTDERIDAILDEVGWPAALRDLDVGDAFVAAATLDGVKASDHIDDVVLAEVGHFFIAVDGKATFRSRTANAGGAASQATFGVGNIEYDALLPTYNDEEVYNDVRITRTGGDPQIVEDATAQTDLGYVITFERESAVFYLDHGALNSADWMLGRHKDVKVRIRGLEWKPQLEGAAGWPAALGTDLRETVTVQFTPPRGTELDQLVAIQGIRHRARGGGEWLTTFDLAPLAAIETDDYWIIGTSELDTEAKLA